jgi:hypothetical protein
MWVYFSLFITFLLIFLLMEINTDLLNYVSLKSFIPVKGCKIEKVSLILHRIGGRCLLPVGEWALLPQTHILKSIIELKRFHGKENLFETSDGCRDVCAAIVLCHMF